MKIFGEEESSTSGGIETPVLVDEEGHAQVDIVSMPAVDIDIEGLASSGNQEIIILQVGEVQETPSQYTLLGRLKSIWDRLAGIATGEKQDVGNNYLSSIDNYRSGVTKEPLCTTVTSSGGTTLITPTLGKAIRMFWVSAMNSPANDNNPLLKIGFGEGTNVTSEKYRTYAVAHYEKFEGAVNENLNINLSTTGSVAVTIHYEEFTPV